GERAGAPRQRRSMGRLRRLQLEEPVERLGRGVGAARGVEAVEYAAALRFVEQRERGEARGGRGDGRAEQVEEVRGETFDRRRLEQPLVVLQRRCQAAVNFGHPQTQIELCRALLKR